MRPTLAPTVPSNKKAYWIAAVTTLAVIALDQISKAVVESCCAHRVVLNKAAAFGLPIPLWGVAIAFVVLLIVLGYSWKSWPSATRAGRAWVIGLLLGGALSNLFDRFVYGAVRDFIDLRVWPVFNLADTALSLGVVLLLWYALRSSRTSHAARQGEQTGPRGTDRRHV